MTIKVGTRIAHYEVTGWLGAGGMGEVHRARDLKLDRDVAIKLLSGLPAPENVRRFRREAKLLAALNHPHIAQIYGVEDVGDQVGLVLEFVDGDSLDSTIAAHAGVGLPIERAIEIARQVASALEAAHDKGIVHRDLKPANIKMTNAGTVKVLDFGIATTPVADAQVEPDARTRTTEYAASTIAGTVPYMSPEQALGRAVDARSDIWAFGCVLFEMLAGRHPFPAGTTLETLAAIVEREPAWDALPSTVSAHVRDVLRRCLEKDPQRRLPAIGDARRALDEPARRHKLWVGWYRFAATGFTLLAVAAVLAAVGVLISWTRDRTPPLVLAKSRQLTTHAAFEDYPTIAPDGYTVAYESNQTGHWDIWVASAGGGTPVSRTADHRGDDRYPSWSPEGSQIAFWSDRDGGGYYLMPAIGGAASRLYGTANVSATKLSPAAWSPDGGELALIAYLSQGSALIPTLVTINVRTRDVRTRPLPGTEESRLDLSWSPNGQLIAYLDAAQQPSESTRLRVYRLSDGRTFEITDATLNARSPLWSRDGRSLYFVWNKTGAADLWRRSVDATGAPAGETEQVTTGVEVLHATFSAAGDRLVIAKGRWVANVWRVPLRLGRAATWDDAKQVTTEHAFIEFIDVSPDDRTLAFSSDRAGNQDLWTMDLGSGATTQMTRHEAPEWAPRFSPLGDKLAFYATRSGDREIYSMGVGGGDVLQLTVSPGLDATPDWSPNGSWLAFRSERSGSSDIWVVSADGRQQRPIAPHPEPDYGPTWSPDGQWLAFGSHRDGRARLWRAQFPEGRAELITTAEDVQVRPASARWSRFDARLYFIASLRDQEDLWSIVPGESQPARRETNLRGRRGSLMLQPVCPSTGYLYFSWREDPADIWLIDIAR